MNREFERPDLQPAKRTLITAAEALQGKSQADLADLYSMLNPEAQRLLENLVASRQQREQVTPVVKQETAEQESWETIGEEFSQLRNNPSYEVMKALAALTQGESHFKELTPLEDLNRLEQMASARNAADLPAAKQLLNIVRQTVIEFPNKYNPNRFLDTFDNQFYNNSKLVEMAMKFAGVERKSPPIGEQLSAHEVEKYDVRDAMGAGNHFEVSEVLSHGYMQNGKWIRRPKVAVRAY